MEKMKPFEEMSKNEVDSFVKLFASPDEYKLLLETASAYSANLSEEDYDQLLEVLFIIYSHAIRIGILAVHDLMLHNRLIEFMKCNTAAELVEVVQSFKEWKKGRQH